MSCDITRIYISCLFLFSLSNFRGTSYFMLFKKEIQARSNNSLRSISDQFFHFIAFCRIRIHLECVCFQSFFFVIESYCDTFSGSWMKSWAMIDLVFIKKRRDRCSLMFLVKDVYWKEWEVGQKCFFHVIYGVKINNMKQFLFNFEKIAFSPL